MKRSGAIIFHAPAGPSGLEHMVASAREASACDLIESLQSLVPTIVAVCPPDSAAVFESLGVSVQVVSDTETFHFGETLKQVISNHQLDAVIYFGSGSGTLLNQEQLADMVAFSQRPQTEALFNNYYSCDFAVFTDTAPLLQLPLPDSDNGLGFMLSDFGVKCYGLPRSLASQFDLDTPIDLLLLKEAARGGPRLQTFLDTQQFDHPNLRQINTLLIK